MKKNRKRIVGVSQKSGVPAKPRQTSIISTFKPTGSFVTLKNGRNSAFSCSFARLRSVEASQDAFSTIQHLTIEMNLSSSELAEFYKVFQEYMNN